MTMRDDWSIAYWFLEQIFQSEKKHDGLEVNPCEEKGSLLVWKSIYCWLLQN